MSHVFLIAALECSHKDIEKELANQMAPFDENGEWFRDGSRWDWYIIGGRYQNRLLGSNIIQRKSFDLEVHRQYKEERLTDFWIKTQEDFKSDRYKNFDDSVCNTIFGMTRSTTLEEYLQKYKPEIFSAPVFLRNHNWEEGGRMGWWGQKVSTECEIREKEVKRCRFKDSKTEAITTTWNEDDEKWNANYYERFIKHLDPELYLVGVDYHV